MKGREKKEAEAGTSAFSLPSASMFRAYKGRGCEQTKGNRTGFYYSLSISQHTTWE